MSYARPKMSRLLDPSLLTVEELTKIKKQITNLLPNLESLNARASTLFMHVTADNLTFSQNDVVAMRKITRSTQTAFHSLLSILEDTVLVKLE